MIRAVIFDLDGVIADTAHYHYLAWKRLAKELGVDLTPEQNEKIKGVSRKESLEFILQLGGIEMPDEEKEKKADRKNEWFVQYIHKMKPEEIFPGVCDLLHKLRAAGYKVALASSSKNAKIVLELLEIEHLFDVMVDGTMITHTKPDPEIFLLTARLLNMPPSACVVFEDAVAGVEAALAAGMKCVGVGTSQQLRIAHQVVKETRDFNIDDLKFW